ncbi:hypothetical protein KR009_009948, partial [Drosophila setifemur]
KDCKCTPEKCSEGCKCPSPEKCGCNPAKTGKKGRDSGDAKGKCCGGGK